MTLDDRIDECLEKHTKWSGNADTMWSAIQSELQPTNPWWKTQTLWLGPVVAATILLVFWIQNLLTPLPPLSPAADQVPQLRSFSLQMDFREPLVVGPGAELTIALESREEIAREFAAAVSVMDLKLNEEIMFEEINLSEENILQQSVTAFAPTQPGHYLLTVQGTMAKNDKFYFLYGEQEFTVNEGKDDSNVQQN